MFGQRYEAEQHVTFAAGARAFDFAFLDVGGFEHRYGADSEIK